MEMIVNLKEHSYPIYIEKNILKKANEKIKTVFKGKKIMIISDDQVYPLYGEALTNNLASDYTVGHVVVEHGEQSKRFDMLPMLYKACLDFKLTRTDLIIALGGGVIGDMAGFVASSYLRGVQLVQIPTSLLAQVDSSVGGKVAVDLPDGKNLVGAFYHPSMVLIDPTTLKTLSPHFINDGMGEVIKYGCIKDKNLFDKLNQYHGFDELYESIDDIIYTCVDIKRDVVEKDQFDFGDRLLLNFGHTYGHAIEQYYHYKKYSHGEAVAMGMYQITKLSETQGMTQSHTSDQIKEILEKYHLPYQCNVVTQDLMKAIALDKKNINNSLSLVLLKEIGHSFVYKTNQEFLLKKERV
ncbi:MULTISPECIES: 3-dehydroquinate synthase [Coprobacillaceae]|uniref:3-dehydroquinate synthase n=1 Tax=Coprobacillaceae TaxID=2810280 RepID=UPI000E503389|nr:MULTISPECIES: 3-dehydroquinate synthase [Coprobacillaceae]RHM58889.1 3-dehydroquinate synthase [Coprobacillus sp. AF33-1AC]RHS91238.1 3-dehydroquinate synthase [Erysipelatoclostridium sp. AM42-17]